MQTQQIQKKPLHFIKYLNVLYKMAADYVNRHKGIHLYNLL